VLIILAVVDVVVIVVVVDAVVIELAGSPSFPGGTSVMAVIGLL
jgi:hypothetical protein